VKLLIYLFFQADGRWSSDRLVSQPLLLVSSRLASFMLELGDRAVLLVCALSMFGKVGLCAPARGSLGGSTVDCAISSSLFGAKVLSRADTAVPSENRGILDGDCRALWAQSVATGASAPCLPSLGGGRFNLNVSCIPILSS
jgi:hypothetical protein